MKLADPPSNGPPDLEGLDFTGLTNKDVVAVKMAVARRENFFGYIPENGLAFIIRNYRPLARGGLLEAPWLDAYVHASHFGAQGISVVKDVFDACDRNRLLALKPLGEGLVQAGGDRLTLFRGCAGPVHSMGMSWTQSLDKAIWYAAHHAEHYELANPAVYVTTVSIAEIYCRLDHYDADFIVYSDEGWCVDVPAREFRLDRRR